MSKKPLIAINWEIITEFIWYISTVMLFMVAQQLLEGWSQLSSKNTVYSLDIYSLWVKSH